MRKLTEDDFILKQYEWTKTSVYALTKDNMLLRYDGHKEGFPIYYCLYEGWFEVSDVCGVGYITLAEAKPITKEQAREIIKKEAKPRSQRPAERNSWLNC